MAYETCGERLLNSLHQCFSHVEQGRDWTHKTAPHVGVFVCLFFVAVFKIKINSQIKRKCTGEKQD